MKKNMKILMLSASMFVMTLVPSTLKADDFSGQESYYIDFCSLFKYYRQAAEQAAE